MGWRDLAGSLCLVLLAACGGGGGGGSGSGGTSAAVSFTPSTLDLTQDEGEQRSFTVDVTPHTTFSGTVYVLVVDPQHLLSPAVSVSANGQGGVVASLTTSGARDFGAYDGSFQVHLCKTADCSAEYEGSPVALPYHVTVQRHDPSVTLFNAQGNLLVKDFPAGDVRTVPLTLITNRWPEAGLYVKTTDAQGRFGSTLAVPPGTSGQVNTALALPVTLPDAPGGYDGSFTATVCRDAACTMPVGSFSYNYQLYVEGSDLVDAAANATPVLTALQPLQGAAAGWPTVAGNAARTGYLPVTLDPSRFSLRWQWALPAGKQYGLTQPAVAAGRVAVAAASLGGSADTAMFVLNEDNGTVRWQLDGNFSAQVSFSPAALDASRLYTVTNGTFAATLRAHDADTGTVQFTTPVNSNFSNDLPPVLAGGSVLMASNATGAGVAAVAASNGQQQWLRTLAGSQPWIPSVSGNLVYQFSGGRLSWFDAATGNPLGSVQDTEWPDALPGGGVSQTITVSDSGLVFVLDRGLAAFDPVAGTVAWSEHSSTRIDDHVNGVAAQGGTLIVLRQAPLRVEARRPADGTVLWSYRPYFNAQATAQGSANTSFIGTPVLTDNLVFVSTDLGVYAIDRSSGTPRWFYGKPGHLAISANGTLLIAKPGYGGGVTAINLH